MPVIITGISPESIGSSTAMAIASQAPRNLILASRTASKLDAVAADIAEKYPAVTVHKIPLDLASLDSIKAAVEQIDPLVEHVDGAWMLFLSFLSDSDEGSPDKISHVPRTHSKYETKVSNKPSQSSSTTPASATCTGTKSRPQATPSST